MTDDSSAESKPVAPARWATGGPLRVMALLALLVAGFVFFEAVSGAQNVLADWHAYYRAATNLLAGRDIYAEGRTLLERNSYDYWVETDGQYVYAPLLAAVLTPLAAALNIGKAGDVWLVVLVLALGGALVTVARVLDRPLLPETLAPLAVPVIASVPVLLSIRYGQVDLVLVLATTLALLAYVRQRHWLAGLALGAAVAIKPTLALYGLFFLRKRRWESLGVAALTAVVLGLGPFLVLGGDTLDEWLAIARYFSSGDYATYPSNQSVRGLLLRAFTGGPKHAPLLENPGLGLVLWLAAAAVALVLWWVVVSARPTRGARATAEFGLTATLILLIAPLSEDIHYVALLPALALMGDQATWGSGERPRWWVGLALAACAYFLLPWLDFAYNRGGGPTSRLVYSGAFLYGLVLAGLALMTYLTSHRSSLGAGTSQPVQAAATMQQPSRRAEPPPSG